MKLARLILIAGTVFSLGALGCMGDGDDGGGDGGGTEEATPDEDTGGDVPVTPTDDVVEDKGPEACTNECTAAGAQECVGASSFHVCGPQDTCHVWGAETFCPPGETCNPATGQCEGEVQCEDECANIGDTTCKGLAAVAECQADQDGCKSYVTIKECEEGQTCENAVCGGGAGDGDCGGMISCMALCGEDQACLQACYDDASADAQAAYDAMEACVQPACGDLMNDPTKAQLCALKNCEDELAGCTGLGDLGCQGIIGCMQQCGQTDQACMMDCLNDGSAAGQIALLEIEVCLVDNCSDCNQTDTVCLQGCLQEHCMTEYNACQ